jgi:hypothetical protein
MTIESHGAINNVAASGGLGYLRSHDYDILTLLALIVTICTIVSYITLSYLIDIFCCIKPQKKKKLD